MANVGMAEIGGFFKKFYLGDEQEDIRRTRNFLLKGGKKRECVDLGHASGFC